jgi:hypothetical protein
MTEGRAYGNTADTEVASHAFMLHDSCAYVNKFCLQTKSLIAAVTVTAVTAVVMITAVTVSK